MELLFSKGLLLLSVEYGTADFCRLTLDSLVRPADAAIKQESCQISPQKLPCECINMDVSLQVQSFQRKVQNPLQLQDYLTRERFSLPCR